MLRGAALVYSSCFWTIKRRWLPASHTLLTLSPPPSAVTLLIVLVLLKSLDHLTMLSKSSLALLWAAVVAGHGDHGPQSPIAGPHQSLWYNNLPGDGGTQVRRTLA